MRTSLLISLCIFCLSAAAASGTGGAMSANTFGVSSVTLVTPTYPPTDYFPVGGTNLISIEFVEIAGSANPDNMLYTHTDPFITGTRIGAGAVPESFRMSKYLLSVAEMKQFMTNAVFDWWPDPPNAWVDQVDGTTNWSWGDDTPLLTYNQVHRMKIVNWMNRVHGYPNAYRFDGEERWQLWSWADSAVSNGRTNRYRHKDAFYFLPSSDEYMKAMFWDEANWKYWKYMFGSDTAPTYTSVTGNVAGTIVANYDATNGPAPVKLGGGVSLNGFYSMGLAWDNIETRATGTNDSTADDIWVIVFGGKWTHGVTPAYPSNDYERPRSSSTNYWYGGRTRILYPTQSPPVPGNPYGYCAPNAGLRIASKVP